MNDQPGLFLLTEAAERTGLTVDALRKRIRRGKLGVVKGNDGLVRVRLTSADMEALRLPEGRTGQSEPSPPDEAGRTIRALEAERDEARLAAATAEGEARALRDARAREHERAEAEQRRADRAEQRAERAEAEAAAERTRSAQADRERIILPLSHFLERPFQNWTRNSSELLDTAFLHVDYSVPVAAVRAKAREILEATPLWDRRAWAVQVTGLREGSMEIRVLMSAADAGRMWDLRCHVREELVAFVAREYPSGLPRTRVELGAGLAADGQPAAKGGAAGTVQAGAIVCGGAAPVVEAGRSSLEAAV